MNDKGLSGPAGESNKVILSLAQFVESIARKTFSADVYTDVVGFARVSLTCRVFFQGFRTKTSRYSLRF